MPDVPTVFGAVRYVIADLPQVDIFLELFAVFDFDLAQSLGSDIAHDARLMPAKNVRQYSKGEKNRGKHSSFALGQLLTKCDLRLGSA